MYRHSVIANVRFLENPNKYLPKKYAFYENQEDKENQPPGTQKIPLRQYMKGPVSTVSRDDDNKRKQPNNQVGEKDSITNEAKENVANGDQNQEDEDTASDSESSDDVQVIIGDIRSTRTQHRNFNIKRTDLLTSATSDDLRVIIEDIKSAQAKRRNFNIKHTDLLTSTTSDNVQVVTRDDIKSTRPQHRNVNIKRTDLLTSTTSAHEKLSPRTEKFSIDDFETIGVINGIPAHQCNLDQLRDKPWRQPGSDITDFFNYGFNEETWKAYCERQNRMRSESGVGVVGSRVEPQVTIDNHNSRYSGIAGPKKAGPPPGGKMVGTIDVIGSYTGSRSWRNLDKLPGSSFPDMSVPPPGLVVPSTFDMPPGFSFPDMSVPPPGYQRPPAPYFMPQMMQDNRDRDHNRGRKRCWNRDCTYQRKRRCQRFE